MKHHIHIILATATASIAFTGCGIFSRPSVGTAGYYIDNRPESKATVVIGSNGTQANAIHGQLDNQPGTTGGETASEKSPGAGQFVNWNSGNRSADIDATAAIEQLHKVSGTTAGQSSARDASPQTTTQSPTTTEERTTNTTIPVAVSQGAANATAPAAASDAKNEQ